MLRCSRRHQSMQWYSWWARNLVGWPKRPRWWPNNFPRLCHKRSWPLLEGGLGGRRWLKNRTSSLFPSFSMRSGGRATWSPPQSPPQRGNLMAPVAWLGNSFSALPPQSLPHSRNRTAVPAQLGSSSSALLHLSLPQRGNLTVSPARLGSSSSALPPQSPPQRVILIAPPAWLGSSSSALLPQSPL